MQAVEKLVKPIFLKVLKTFDKIVCLHGNSSQLYTEVSAKGFAAFSHCPALPSLELS